MHSLWKSGTHGVVPWLLTAGHLAAVVPHRLWLASGSPHKSRDGIWGRCGCWHGCTHSLCCSSLQDGVGLVPVLRWPWSARGGSLSRRAQSARPWDSWDSYPSLIHPINTTLVHTPLILYSVPLSVPAVFLATMFEIPLVLTSTVEELF